MASGTAVRGLPGIEPDGQGILTSDDALAQETLPRSVIVLGGGAVGVEFAYVYRAFGADVAIVEMEGPLLPRTDREVAKELEKILGRQGIRGSSFRRIDGLREDGSGKAFLRITCVPGARASASRIRF